MRQNSSQRELKHRGEDCRHTEETRCDVVTVDRTARKNPETHGMSAESGYSERPGPLDCVTREKREVGEAGVNDSQRVGEV